MLCDFIMSHGAHAAIPVLLPVGETWGALSVVFTMSLVADLVAHRAVIGQPYQGLCVYIRSWLSVCSLLLSSFPACVQLWAPLPRCEPECQVHSCWPALPASCSCPGTRDPGQEESCRLLVLLVPYTFPDTSCSAQSSTYAWSQTESFSVLRTLPGALGLERGKENVKRIDWGHWLCNKSKVISQAQVSAMLGWAVSSLL